MTPMVRALVATLAVVVSAAFSACASESERAGGALPGAGAGGLGGAGGSGVGGAVTGGAGGTAGSGVGGASAGGAGGTAGSGVGGASAGGVGGTAGGGGTVGGGGWPAFARWGVCAQGLPCDAGTHCRVREYESNLDCYCDPTGHLFCGSVSGSGGSQSVCNTCPADAGEPPVPPNYGQGCSSNNGWCSLSWPPDAGCSIDCSGDGAAPTPMWGARCQPEVCARFVYGYWCEYHDGDCSYTLNCVDHAATVTGACP